MVVRTITSKPPQRYTLTNPTVIADGSRTLIGMSRDRTTFFAKVAGSAAQLSKLVKSIDGGTTWTTVKDFNTVLTNCVIVNMLELPNGEILIGLSPFGSFATHIYKSTGWATNQLTATYADKSGSLFQVSSLDRYSLNDGCLGTNGVVLASESGSQTDSHATMGITITNAGSGYTTITLTATSGGTGESIAANIVSGAVTRIAILAEGTGHTPGVASFGVAGDGSGFAGTYTVAAGGNIQTAQTAKARRLFLSTDFGNNWSQIFDIYTTPVYKYASGVHLHACAYHEDWDRIWLLFGDNTGDGTTISGYPTNTQLYYSDDRGSTWTLFPAATKVEGDTIQGQYTSIRVLKNAIVLGGDAMGTAFNVLVYPITGYKTVGNPVFGPGYVNNNSLMEQFRSAYSLNSDYPLFCGFLAVSSTQDANIIMSPDGGASWFEIWRETDLGTRPAVSAGCIKHVLGPDTSNRILGQYNGYSSFLQGTLVKNW